MEENADNPSLRPEGAFLKSVIKMSNPTWTSEQIEVEYQRRISLKDTEEDGGCEMCSG